MNLKQLLLDAGLNMGMLAEQLGTKTPYVSMYISGRGQMPRVDWQLIHDWFHELRARQSS